MGHTFHEFIYNWEKYIYKNIFFVKFGVWTSYLLSIFSVTAFGH